MGDPYYEDEYVTLYHGDCREVLSDLAADLVLTDPPYGIGQDKGMGVGGYDGFGKGEKRQPTEYPDAWDGDRPAESVLRLILASAKKHIIWGGNHFSDLLPLGRKWLVWDKKQTMPTYSDAELAWTSLDGVSVQMFEYNGSGLMARETNRAHPTQKPVTLMEWCLQQAESSTVLDPYAGAGSTLIAAKNLSRKAIGVEIEERYCEVAAERLSQQVLAL